VRVCFPRPELVDDRSGFPSDAKSADRQGRLEVLAVSSPPWLSPSADLVHDVEAGTKLM
jgi:hypothetical protein